MEKPLMKYCPDCKKETKHFIWNETEEEVCEECFLREEQRLEAYYELTRDEEL